MARKASKARSRSWMRPEKRVGGSRGRTPAVSESGLFEELGIRYLGPIDDTICRCSSARWIRQTCDHPISIHILTQKGNGFEAALKFPEKFHASRLTRETGETPATKPGTPPMYQDVMARRVKLCQKNNTISASPPDANRHGHEAFGKGHADVTCWACRGHRRDFRGGNGGRWVSSVVAIYSTFLSARLRLHSSRCLLAGLARHFCMDRAGLPRMTGPTHHGLFDIAYLRWLPERHRVAPANEERTRRHDVYRDAPESSGVIPLSTRRGGRRAGQRPAAIARKSARRRSSRIFRPTEKRKSRCSASAR